MRDTDCDFRMFRRQLHHRPSADIDQRSDLRRDDAIVPIAPARAFVEIPVHHYFRPSGKSQFFRLPAIARSARQLLALWWNMVIRGR